MSSNVEHTGNEQTGAGDTPATAPVLEMCDVDAAYHGDISILNGLSLEARERRITGIIGPNGAGKSTALKTMYGFLRPSRGSVTLRGEDISGLPPYSMIGRGVAFVPQNRSLFNDLSVEDNLKLGCWRFRSDKVKVEEALESVYGQFPVLAERRSSLAGSLSGGQQRFVELGRALVSRPSVILLDEPTAMIAPKISREIYEFIATLPERGITIILVDQNVRQCVRVSDFVYILDLGRNRGEGTAQTFAQDAHLKELVREWLDYEID